MSRGSTFSDDQAHPEQLGDRKKMCFSAKASFATSGLLALISVITVRWALKKKEHLMLGTIPIFFAVQQVTEGLLWVSFDETSSMSSYQNLLTHLYLLLALYFWPIWMPLACLAAETIAWRKVIMGLCCALGLIWTFASIPPHMEQNVATKVNGHIEYYITLPLSPYLYGAAILIPCFVSSIKNMWIFGALVAFFAVVAATVYYNTFISVWCFFAALTSLFLFKILRDNIIASCQK